MRGYDASATVIPVPLATPLALEAARRRSAHVAAKEKPASPTRDMDTLDVQSARALRRQRAKREASEAARAARAEATRERERARLRARSANGPLAPVPPPEEGWRACVLAQVHRLGGRRALADELGVSERTIGLWLSGRSSPTGERARRLLARR